VSRRERAEASIAKILAATRSSFATLGYEGASIKVIAERAGVSRALLHYHFASKEELISVAILDLGQRIAQELSQRAVERTPSVEGLVQTAEDVYDLLVADRAHAAFVLELFAAANHTPALRQAWQQLQTEIRGQIVRVVELVMGADAPDSFDPVEVARLVETGILGMCLHSALGEDDAELRRRFDQLSTVVARGFL